MFGLGIIYIACQEILRFSAKYYDKNKGSYTSEEQAKLETLMNAATALMAVIGPLFLPV